MTYIADSIPLISSLLGYCKHISGLSQEIHLGHLSQNTKNTLAYKNNIHVHVRGELICFVLLPLNLNILLIYFFNYLFMIMIGRIIKVHVRGELILFYFSSLKFKYFAYLSFQSSL